jgi:hypothetical protein
MMGEKISRFGNGGCSDGREKVTFELKPAANKLSNKNM